MKKSSFRIMIFALGAICAFQGLSAVRHPRKKSGTKSADSYGDYRVKKLGKVYDGDTFRALVYRVSRCLFLGGDDFKVGWRVAGIDTPEKRLPRALRENNPVRYQRLKNLALAAKAFTEEQLHSADKVWLTNVQSGKYAGRLLCGVELWNKKKRRSRGKQQWEKKDLAKLLIAAGHAKPYRGGKKPVWS